MKVTNKLYNKAKEIAIRDNNYSISYLQRKLQIGYNKAREIVKLLKAQS